VHGCLLDGSSIFRCDRAAAFLRVGGCLVRTSCIVVGLTWPAFGGSLDHGMQVESPSYFDRSLARSKSDNTGVGLRLRRHPI
jgi:hypothetical protein